MKVSNCQNISTKVYESMYFCLQTLVIKRYATKKGKNDFFEASNSQNILTKVYESVFFQMKTLVEVTLKIFQRVVSICSRYLNVTPNIELRVC